MRKMSKERALSLWIFAAVIAVCGAICVFVGIPLIKFASEPERFRLWVDSHGVWGRFAYVLMVILQIIMAFLPGEPFEMVAGYAFGTVEGTILCLLAEAVGSVIVVLLVKKFGIKLVKMFFSEEKINEVKFLKSSPRRVVLLTLLFIVPGTPKDLLCYFAGLTDIKLPLLLIICTITRIPSVLTSTLGGDLLGEQNYLFAVIVFGGTLLLSLGGILIYNAICKKREK